MRIHSTRDEAAKVRDTDYPGQNLYFIDSIQKWMISPGMTELPKLVYRVDSDWEMRELHVLPQAIYFTESYARVVFSQSFKNKPEYRIYRIVPLDCKPCYLIETSESEAVLKYERYCGLSR